MSLVENLKKKLTQELEASLVEIVDDSWQHAGHQGVGTLTEATHLNITVVSPRFEGLNILDQHRLVNQVLQEARDTHLHALQLKTFSPSQWKK